MDTTIQIRQRGTLTLPADLRQRYGIQDGDSFRLVDLDGVFVLTPMTPMVPELAREINDLMKTAPPVSGYRVPRITWHLGRWFRTTDWYPDYQLRLYDRRRGRWKTRRVHESVDVDGTPGQLRHDLQH